MNRRIILFHLREAAEELNRTVKQLEASKTCDEVSLEMAMGHLYHHLNTAWNGRRQTDKQFRNCTDKDFERFRRFPKQNEFTYLTALKKVCG